MSEHETERRQSYAELNLRLEAVEHKLEKIDKHIEEFLEIWNQSLGVWKALKLVFYVTAPIVAVSVWLKDHVKL